MVEILPYKRLLEFLRFFFKDGEFTSAQVSHAFILFLDPFDSGHLLTKRFKTKLMSNGLRRLKAYELVDRRPVPVEIVTKSGKTGHRGRRFKYRITAKGFRFLEKTRMGPWSIPLSALMVNIGWERGELGYLAPGYQAHAWPPTSKRISRRAQRLPNRVVSQKEDNQLFNQVTNLLQGIAEETRNQLLNEMIMKTNEMRKQAMYREAEKRQTEQRDAAEQITTAVEENIKKTSEEMARETARVIAENEAKKARIGGEFLKKLEPLTRAARDTSPEAEELMKKLFAEKDSKDKDSSELQNDKSDTADGES